ncbi:MAG: hypothetical protein GQ570_06315 [Helicobacteraceae bacterium]|nr:hypothetical protein [Helicobacteraceae bacterium]
MNIQAPVQKAYYLSNDNSTFKSNVRVLDQKEIERYNDTPTALHISGNIYDASSKPNFKTLNKNELLNENIVLDRSKQIEINSTNGSSSSTYNVALRDPLDSDKIITVELTKKTIDKLKEKFNDQDENKDPSFFLRDDGILRLNGKAEEYVASWLNDITNKRNYSEADGNGDGKISNTESLELNAGFENVIEYNYLSNKITDANRGVTNSYASLKDTAGYEVVNDEVKKEAHINVLTSINFEDSIEKELNNTINMDEDLDGTITAKEGFEDQFGENYLDLIQTSMQRGHDAYLLDNPEENIKNKLQYRGRDKDEIDKIAAQREEEILPISDISEANISKKRILNVAFSNLLDLKA